VNGFLPATICQDASYQFEIIEFLQKKGKARFRAKV
jgi:hypothetical protein